MPLAPCVSGQDNPLILAAFIAAGGLCGKWWLDDYRAARRGAPRDRPLPGALPAEARANLVAIAGALGLLAAETAGEYALGISREQSRLTVLGGAYTLAAAFVEELIFRGYVVVENRGRRVLVAGIVAASAVFALLHPFFWSWEDGRLALHGGTKAWFSTAAVFAGSLWFYTVRFFALNPRRSLVPCIAAHGAKNLGVFAIKLAQGFVTGWW